jgi:signal transduction histidine kinase/ActR/RegA family two-component response regulator
VLSSTPHPLLLSGGNALSSAETGRLLLETDWSRTALGPQEDWPQSLRIAVSICLNSRFPMFLWWGPELINIYNDAYIPILGRRHPQAFGRPAREFWHEIWDVLGPQQQAVMERGEATWNERVLLVMERNGYTEPTYFTWSYSPIYREDGTIGGLFCACSEETGRVAAERERDRLVAQAQHTAQMLQTWFDNAPGFVALLRGPRHVFEMVNKAYYQLVGHRDILGKPAFEALPETREQGLEALMNQVYETGVPYVGHGLKLRLQRGPGEPPVERFVDFVYQPVFDATGQVGGVFAQGHDVTGRVLATKALEEADRRKDEFLATLAHELRNPLAPLRQAARLVRDPEVGAERHGWALDVIERQVGNMTLLIDDLLDVSRISRGKLELRLGRVDLRELVDAGLESAMPALRARGHEVRALLPAEPVWIDADAVRIEQVLLNLLSNAGKYTDPGGRIEIAAAVESGMAVLRVRDNGIGLSANDRERVFGMFSQVRSALDRAEGGLGIGLALSRGLVLLHGGRIEAVSEGPGLGSEFVVHLPLATASAIEASPPLLQLQSQSTRSQPRPVREQPRRVLLADDNRDALETMALLLETHGHEVHTAGDGEEALARLRELQPEVAILDIGMPRLNGYEVAQRIRAEPGGQDLLMIALTGWGQTQDQERAMRSGFDFHCTKPVEISRLLELLHAPRRAASTQEVG